jgi:hypothetical protein
MNTVGNFVLVESIDEIRERSVWDKGNEICTMGLGIFHNVLNISYPHVFEIYWPEDAHCCGDCYPCSNRDMITAVDNEIHGHEQSIERLRNLRKTLKENI